MAQYIKDEQKVKIVKGPHLLWKEQFSHYGILVETIIPLWWDRQPQDYYDLFGISSSKVWQMPEGMVRQHCAKEYLGLTDIEYCDILLEFDSLKIRFNEVK